MSIYELKKDINLVFLEGEEAFNQLDNSEKLYAYYMSKAAWVGSLITSKQVSPESHDLIKFCVSIFHENDKLDNMVSMGLKHGFSEEESNDFLNYFAIICANMGNYRSFGDSKIIPHIEKRRMIELVSALFKDYLIVFMKLVDKIYSLESKERLLGFPPTGTTSYFSSNVTKDEVSKVDRYLVSKGIEGWNTQLTKVDTESGPIYFINIASAQIPPEKHVISIEEFEGSDMSVVYGNYSEELGFVNNYLQSARDNVDKSKYPDRNKMILAYIDHFRYGDIADHKRSQSHWIKDIGPTVETNMGFIENYRDPAGVRSEFEAFVSVVDKEKSLKLKALVDRAPEFIETLPWPKEFEKDTFNPPDFTALDVITFAGSGVPAGINIPNYDDIRQKEGFKNVSLDNVIRSAYGSNGNEPEDYLTEEDNNLYKKYVLKSFAVDVAGHELLGHGSGKLFQENIDGTFNFDKEKTVHPITGDVIKTWYKPGETWGSQFKQMGSSYEECRAECVGLFLATNHEMHKIFEHTDDEWEDVMYISWLWMMKGGIASMAAYDPDSKEWKQAHSQARYAIYRVMLEAGEDFVRVIKNDAGDNFTVCVDRSKIISVGIPALKNFLLKLGVYKTTADVVEGTKMYMGYSEIDAEHEELLNIHLKRKKPRSEYIQPTLIFYKSKEGVNSVKYKRYEAVNTGMIKSIVDKLGYELEDLNQI